MSVIFRSFDKPRFTCSAPNPQRQGVGQLFEQMAGQFL